MPRKILFLVNVDWFFISHRLPLALAAKKEGFEVHIACGMTNCLPELEKLGFVVHPLMLNRGIANPLRELVAFFEIYRLLKATSPYLVHLVTIKPVLLGGIATRLAGVPSVVSAVSGLGYVFVAKGIFASFRRLLVTGLYRLAMGHRNLKVIFQNAEDKASLVRLIGLADTKTTMIRGSGVDLCRYVASPLPPNERIVVMASRLLVDKGVEEFVEAARLLQSRYSRITPLVRFVLVGEPDMANPNSVTANQLKAWVDEGVIEHWGHRRDMPEVLSAASIVTLPSYYGEGLPKVLIEAAACGRPVVTTDHPGCRDAIESAISGFLVPVRDAQALADAIQFLLDHPEKCAAMGVAGRDLAERAFDVKQVVVAHLQIYEELMANATR